MLIAGRLLQPGVLSLRLLEDGDVGVGVFPEGEEVLAILFKSSIRPMESMFVSPPNVRTLLALMSRSQHLVELCAAAEVFQQRVSQQGGISASLLIRESPRA